MWLWILSVLAFVDGEILKASIGVLIAGAAAVAVVWCAPWRHPVTPYGRLMAPVYFLLSAALGWGAWYLGSLRAMGLGSWWSLFLLLPLSLPLWIAGQRRWSDGDASRAHAPAGEAQLNDD